MTAVQRGYAFYGDDEITIGIKPDAPDAMGVYLVASPGLGEAEIKDRVQSASDELYLRGLLVTSVERVRNPVFDGPLERTTAEITVRPCRNQAEAERVLREIYRVLADGGILEHLASDGENALE